MRHGDYFFLIFLLSIIIVRVFLYFKPIASPTINKLRFHHYMLGILFVGVSLLLKNLMLYAIGWGLFIDELTYILMGGKNHQDNYSIVSLGGTILFAFIIYFARNILIVFFKI